MIETTILENLQQLPEPLKQDVLQYVEALVKQYTTSTAAAPQLNTMLDLLKQIEAIQAQVPAAEWDKLPHDGSINHDHYLYGSPKVEE